MARKTKAEQAVQDEQEYNEEQQPMRERWGFSLRVECVNGHCANAGVEQIVRVQRSGDVYLVPYFHCCKCLYQMVVINPAIAEPLGMMGE